MSTSQLIGTVGVAVDHSDTTLNRYLADLAAVKPPSALIRRALAATAASGGADSLVICPEDADWVAENCAEVELILGLPDVHDGDDVLDLLDEAGSNVSTLAFPVKLGLPASHPDVLRPVSIVNRIRMHRPGLKLVVEPYFAKDVNLVDRA